MTKISVGNNVNNNVSDARNTGEDGAPASKVVLTRVSSNVI